MGRLSYGDISREKACQLLEALLDFNADRLDPDCSEKLRKKGLRCDRSEWQTPQPKLDILSTREVLIELVQCRYQEFALIDNKSKLKEALDHLEQTVGCLRLRRKKPGQRLVDGTLNLSSTEPTINLETIRLNWPQKKNPSRKKDFINRAEPTPAPEAVDGPSSQPTESAQSGVPHSHQYPKSPQSTFPGAEDRQSEKDEQNTNTQNTNTQDSHTQSDTGNWETIFDQVAATLKQSIPHSPLLRAALKVLGLNPRANIRPSDRQYLIERVEKIWLNDYMRNALGIGYQWPTLKIDLTNQPSALAQYRNILWENPQFLDNLESTHHAVSLSEQFNHIRPLRRLLILGAPGSGKTIALLELLQPLLNEARESIHAPVPVVLNLSTYGQPPTGRHFTHWLTAQLEQQYSLTQALGDRFIATQKLLLLLDGLDEVRPHLRNACIRQINEFLRLYRDTECVVCSRLAEYEANLEALQLEASLRLQPLMPAQAVTYLEQLPNAITLNSLIRAIQTNPDFQQLAETPLMLNVMAVAYQHLPSEAMPDFATEDDHRAYLYDAVLERLLNRKQPVDKRLLPARQQEQVTYSPAEVRTWLVWLAKQMVDHDQTTFFIEQLSASWLETSRQHQGYRLHSHAFVGIVIGAISACHMTPIAGWHETGESTRYFLPLLATGVGSSVLASLLFMQLRDVFPQILAGFFAASVYVVFFAAVGHPFINGYSWGHGLGRLSPIAIDWLGMSLFWGVMRNQTVIIHQLSWSWISALRFTVIGMLSYFCLYFPIRFFLLGLYQGDYWMEIAYEPLLISGFTMSYGGLARGNALIPEQSIQPNQGMRRALRNAALLAMTMGSIGMFAAWQYAHGNPYEYAMIALSIGLFAALLGGQRSGQVLIQHFVLRIILWWNRYAPWNYARFLEFATRQMLVKRMGGGYLFMHRSFMEHLANKY